MYDYSATADEELSIIENATYDLYEDDGEWSLVGAHGKKEVGYCPTAYLEVSAYALFCWIGHRPLTCRDYT